MAGRGAYYTGVEAPGGYGSYGYVVHADGRVYNASSGGALEDGWVSLDTPPGQYTIHGGQNDRFKPGDHNKGDKGTAYKGDEYQLSRVGTAASTAIPDPRYKGPENHPGKRTDVFAHLIHGYLGYGSHGCIAVQSRKGVPQFANDGTINVDESSKSLTDAQQKVNQWLSDHHQPTKTADDFKKMGDPVKPENWGRSGERSKTKRGNKINATNYGVLIGPQGRIVTYKTAPLEGGGMVTKGTSSIVVGPPQHEVSGVTHMTTDGSPIDNGEDSIQMLT